jgi:hypothetical protein
MQNFSSDLLSRRISESRQNSGDEYKFLQYATRIGDRHQRIVHHALAGRGFPSLLPLYQVRRRRSDLIVEIEELLFLEASEAAPSSVTVSSTGRCRPYMPVESVLMAGC